MDTTTVEIPTELLAAARLAPGQVGIELAKWLYRQGRINAAQANMFSGEMDLHKSWKDNNPGHLNLDEFISRSAHDLKSPLNAVIGFTNVVLKGIDGPVSEIQETDLTLANNNGQRMLALVNNLVDMARLNTNEMEIELIEDDLLQTIAETCQRWKARNPGFELQTTFSLHNPLAKFDPARLSQIISGLLSYAAFHVAEGGLLTLNAIEERNFKSIEIQSGGGKVAGQHEMDLNMIRFICHGLIALHGGELEIGEPGSTGIHLKFTLPKN